MATYPTQVQASYIGGKPGGEFDKGGERIQYGAKVQFLVDGRDNESEFLFVTESSWEKAVGAPALSSLEKGDEFLLAGDVVLRGREGWFTLRRVEPV